MIDRLEQMEQRYEELSAQLSLPEIVNDREKYQKAGKALSDLETPVMKFRELKIVRQALGRGARHARRKRPRNARHGRGGDRRSSPRASRLSKKRSRCCCCPRTPTTRRT